MGYHLQAAEEYAQKKRNVLGYAGDAFLNTWFYFSLLFPIISGTMEFSVRRLWIAVLSKGFALVGLSLMLVKVFGPLGWTISELGQGILRNYLLNFGFSLLPSLRKIIHLVKDIRAFGRGYSDGAAAERLLMKHSPVAMDNLINPGIIYFEVNSHLGLLFDRAKKSRLKRLFFYAWAIPLALLAYTAMPAILLLSIIFYSGIRGTSAGYFVRSLFWLEVGFVSGGITLWWFNYEIDIFVKSAQNVGGENGVSGIIAGLWEKGPNGGQNAYLNIGSNLLSVMDSGTELGLEKAIKLVSGQEVDINLNIPQEIYQAAGGQGNVEETQIMYSKFIQEKKGFKDNPNDIAKFPKPVQEYIEEKKDFPAFNIYEELCSNDRPYLREIEWVLNKWKTVLSPEQIEKLEYIKADKISKQAQEKWEKYSQEFYPRILRSALEQGGSQGGKDWGQGRNSEKDAGE